MRSAWWGIWQEIESLRGDKAGIEACARQQGRIHRLDLAFGGLWCQEHYQGQLQELKKTMVGDVQRLQDTARHPFCSVSDSSWKQRTKSSGTLRSKRPKTLADRACLE